jgi:type IV pilus assembly protein PilM
MVVAAPITMVKGYYELGSMLGLNVQSIDYVGNSMLQLIKTQTSSTMTTMVIQLGSESTILNIVKGDTLLLQRTVPYGTNSVVTEVMDEQGVDATTAMTLLQNERLITVDFDDNAATGAFRYLINNIGRVIDYYVTKNPDKPIDDVFLVGDGALIRGIDGLFKIQLNIQTKVMDSLYNVKFDNKIDLKIYNPVYLIAAIGAAFAPMGFVPTEVKTKSSSSADYVKIGAAVCAIGIIVGVGAAGASMIMKNNAQQNKASLEAQIAAIADIDQIVSDWETATAKCEEMESVYAQTKNLNENAYDFIVALEENLPKTMVINSYSSNASSVSFSGVSADYDAIAKLAIELKQISCVADTKVLSITESTDSASGEGEEETINYQFIISAVFVDQTEETEEETDTVLPETSAE